MRVVPLVLALCLPALPAVAQSYTCDIARLCTGPASKIGCLELGSRELLRLVIPAAGNGTISTGNETAELVIDRRLPGALDMSYRNTPDGFRVVLQLAPETGRLVVAQLTGGEFELAELACTEAG